MVRILTLLVTVASLLAAPPRAAGQVPTLWVDPVDIMNSRAPIGYVDFFTTMLLDSLSRPDVFGVLDGRTNLEAGAAYHLSSRLRFDTDESYDRESEEYTTDVYVRVDISMRDASGRVAVTEFRDASVGRTYRRNPARRERAETTEKIVADTADSIFRQLTDRLLAYFDIIGTRTRGGPVEGRVVAVMDSTTAVIDKGRIAGLSAGDELDIRRGDVVTDADGTVIFSSMETIGTAEVSDVQDAGALIRTAGFEPQEGDMVVQAVTEGAVAGYAETGEALLDAGFYAAAAREYVVALDADPELLDVLLPLSVAQMMAGDENSAYRSFADLLDTGVPLELATTHSHAFGTCEGTFRLTRESVSYRSPREDDPDHRVDVPLDRVVDSGLRIDTLRMRAPSEEQVEKNEGDSKNWTFRFDVWTASSAVSSLISRYMSTGR